jgi:hypothetical protein
MGRIKILLLLVIALTAVSLPAEAHGGGRARVSVGFVFGGPGWYYPGYYYPPYYYYPQGVSYPAEPTIYIERGDAVAEESRGSQGYWYYCKESRAYHPYVKHCPGGWEKQIPTAAPNR